MKIAIHGRNFAKEARPFVQAMFDTLAKKGAEVQLSADFYQFLTEFGLKTHTDRTYLTTADLIEADFIFSIGGDGTLLESVMQAKQQQIPILGINTGRLGFLATVSPGMIQAALQEIFDGLVQIEERSLVHLASDIDLFAGYNFALNDFVIAKTDTSSMITVHAYLDGEYLNSYWADGLIVSTPTGSTGYSLSCGGPVVLPGNSVFVVSPISPHNLSVRPIIIPDSSELSFRVESRSNNFLVSLDSRFRIVEGSTKLVVRKEKFVAKLVKMKQDSFLNTLRSKLHWGLDARN
ncbi:MAG: NAD kinase [Runella slithyformis]|jgi:NAD+ kinase|nr:MAG: NAD kinase [Runella slithyformis]TAF97409.1 MAG: NAD kinase [Runella sp.]TAG22224.1 MAG: NAD kinase [Cytophagales bacterium]TAG41313.1 MAG: NAD kinase [Cytophagia bacterium]TAF00218.1 MAG: NAD kinase [Runella slithyformis]